jgi:hypothetical protein
MVSLYNCKHDGDQYRITKFDTDMNVESSYLCTPLECECLAATRDTCRHRQMLPRFIAREAVGTAWMYDFDRGGWVHVALLGAEPGAGFSVGPQIASYVELPADSTAEQVAEAFGNLRHAAESNDHRDTVRDASYRRGR